MVIIPQTDLSEWGSDGLLKDPVGVKPHRPPVPPSTFVRRLRTWWHLMSSRLDEMVARATLTEKKHDGFDTLCFQDTSRDAKSMFGKNIHMLGRGCTFCFVTFQINLSSQNFYVNDLGMTRPIFLVPGQNEFVKVEIWRIRTEFSCCRRATVSVLQAYINSRVENNNILCLAELHNIGDGQ